MNSYKIQEGSWPPVPHTSATYADHMIHTCDHMIQLIIVELLSKISTLEYMTPVGVLQNFDVATV